MEHKELNQKIRECNRCGFCQDVCPTYRYTKDEAAVARGRVRLARLISEGKYDWGEEDEITEHIKTCLLCRACVVNCPSAVITDKIMIKAREEINYAKGFSLFHKLLYRGFLSHQERLKIAGSLARFYDRSGARWLVRNSGVLSALRKVKNMENILPLGLEPPLRSQLSKILQQVERPKFKIGYFAGCATNMFFSQIGKAAILYLQHRGCRVEVPEIKCCGGPHQSAGDIREAKKLAQENIETFRKGDFDYIVSDCATCGSTLKEYGELFKNDLEMKDRAQQFSEKILDLNKFVADFLPWAEDLKVVKKKITYHDPCHLVRGLEVTEEPRALLRSIPGVQFIEMKNADWCCGGAGSYCFTQQEMSEKILAGKIANFRETGAEVLATSCPACMMQLAAGFRSNGVKAAIKHPLQLLAESAGVIR